MAVRELLIISFANFENPLVLVGILTSADSICISSFKRVVTLCDQVSLDCDDSRGRFHNTPDRDFHATTDHAHHSMPVLTSEDQDPAFLTVENERSGSNQREVFAVVMVVIN